MSPTDDVTMGRSPQSATLFLRFPQRMPVMNSGNLFLFREIWLVRSLAALHSGSTAKEHLKENMLTSDWIKKLWPIYRSIFTSFHPSIHPSSCLYISLSIYLICLSLSIHPSIHVYLYIFPFINLSICFCIFPSIHSSIYLKWNITLLLHVLCGFEGFGPLSWFHSQIMVSSRSLTLLHLLFQKRHVFRERVWLSLTVSACFTNTTEMSNEGQREVLRACEWTLEDSVQNSMWHWRLE